MRTLESFDLSNKHHRYRARQLGYDVPKMKMGGDVKPFDSFFTKGNKSECWIWIGGTDPDGYGNYCNGNGKSVRAHRFAWVIAFGSIPKGLCVCHDCDTPPCVNPSHLFLGTHGDNVRDKVSKGRQAMGENTAKVKLSKQQATALKRMAGLISGVEAAGRFGISPSAVCAIWKGRSWKSA